MRIKIELQSNHLTLPKSYQAVIQGAIYQLFKETTLGKFYHDQGYQDQQKVFKMFVFSDLFGKFQTQSQNVCFEGPCRFYVASMDELFIETIYQKLNDAKKITLNHQQVNIKKISFVHLPYFEGEKEVILKSMSPVVTYQTQEDKYVKYIRPSDAEFYPLVSQNIQHKMDAYPKDKILYFKILEILYEKERLIKYKNTFYKGYMCGLKVKVNHDTLHILYNTGLSAKGSCGFGMIDVQE